jgi:hypothetical protein
VISKVVPKIWARTNSAIFDLKGGTEHHVQGGFFYRRLAVFKAFGGFLYFIFLKHFSGGVWEGSEGYVVVRRQMEGDEKRGGDGGGGMRMED